MADPIRTAGKDPFEYVAPTAASTEGIKEVRQACRDLSALIQRVTKSSRERSLALTKLEEVSMWANKAIVFSQEE